MYTTPPRESVLEGETKIIEVHACTSFPLSLSLHPQSKVATTSSGFGRARASWILNGLGPAPTDSLGVASRRRRLPGGTSSFTRLKILFILPTVALVLTRSPRRSTPPPPPFGPAG